MKTTIELYILMAVLTITAVLSTNYIASTLFAAGARDFHASCVYELQASNYAPSVVAKLKKEAKNHFGFKTKDCLDVEMVKINGQSIGKVTLRYSYAIPLLKLDKQYKISGYA